MAPGWSVLEPDISFKGYNGSTQDLYWSQILAPEDIMAPSWSVLQPDISSRGYNGSRGDLYWSQILAPDGIIAPSWLVLEPSAALNYAWPYNRQLLPYNEMDHRPVSRDSGTVEATHNCSKWHMRSIGTSCAPPFFSVTTRPLKLFLQWNI